MPAWLIQLMSVCRQSAVQNNLKMNVSYQTVVNALPLIPRHCKPIVYSAPQVPWAIVVVDLSFPVISHNSCKSTVYFLIAAELSEQTRTRVFCLAWSALCVILRISDRWQPESNLHVLGIELRHSHTRERRRPYPLGHTDEHMLFIYAAWCLFVFIATLLSATELYNVSQLVAGVFPFP